MSRSQNLGAIILCGGKSSRMGKPKHLLPFGNETVLERVIRIVSEVAAKIVVVAAADQPLPDLSNDVEIVRDEDEYQGPLAGLMMGLEALPETVEFAYLTGCDVPLLRAEFIEAIFQKISDRQVAVPHDEHYVHPLAGIYRKDVLPLAKSLYASGERRPRELIKNCTAVAVYASQLREVDPHLYSLRNMNTPEDYKSLLDLAGLS